MRYKKAKILRNKRIKSQEAKVKKSQDLGKKAKQSLLDIFPRSWLFLVESRTICGKFSLVNTAFNIANGNPNKNRLMKKYCITPKKSLQEKYLIPLDSIKLGMSCS